MPSYDRNINFPFQSSCQQPNCPKSKPKLFPPVQVQWLHFATFFLSLSVSHTHKHTQSTELLNYFVDIKHIKIQIDDTQLRQQQHLPHRTTKKGTTTTSYNGHLYLSLSPFALSFPSSDSDLSADTFFA